jgi:acyl-CoA reductase-like NAD-dependent aldehyde dehydrogenase
VLVGRGIVPVCMYAAVENANPHGNAACIYTQSGASGEYFASRFRSAMIGVNIGKNV